MLKTHDLCVKVGEYNSNGKVKGEYENIGSLMKNDDGSFFMLLKRTFNPLAVPVPEGRNKIVVSLFAAKQRDEQNAGGYSAPAPAPAPTQQRGHSHPLGDMPGVEFNETADIPF